MRFFEVPISGALPAGTRHATLVLTDTLGRVVVERALANTPEIRETILAGDKPAGLYNCTVFADGVPVGPVRVVGER